MNLKLQTKSKTIYAFLMALFSVWGWGQTPFQMSSGNYLENFDDISNWSNGFASGVGAATWKSVSANTSGTLGNGVRTTVSSSTFTSGTSGGVQKGTGNLQFLSTSTNNAVAADLYLNFISRNAGTLSFDAATVFNSNGNRDSVLKIFYSINNGSTFTELTGTGLPYTARNNVANSSTVNVSLPVSLNNISTVVLRFYEYSTNTGGSSPTGSQPKISIDNLSITSTSGNTPIIYTTGTFSTFSYIEGNGPSTSQSVSVSGNNLDNTTVTIAAPTNYEVSLTNGNDFTDNKTISYSSGTFASQSVFLRLKSGLPVDNYSTGSNLTITGGNAPTTTIALNGSVISPPPANDLCSSAEVIVSGVIVNGSMVNATATSGLAASPTKKDVWYKYTALNSGDHIITANFTSGIDLDIHMYTGACPTSGNAIFIGQTVGGTSEVLNANLVGGTDYYIRVVDYDENATTFTINLQEPLPCVAPTVATNLNLTPSSDNISGTFTGNSASGYMVVVSTNSTLSASPVNATTYNIGDSFGGGTVVKYSAGATFTASNLNQSTNYHFFVFSYNTQCVGEPFYSTASLNGASATLAGPCVSENFSSNTRPNGWIDTDTGITYSSGYADMSVVVGSITTSVLSNPSQLKFDLSRTTNGTAKTLYVEVSTTSQTTGFTTLNTFTHSNTTSGGSINAVIDLSAYSTNPIVYIRFRREFGNTSPWRIDNIQVFCSSPIQATTTWNGTTWSSGTPASTVDAIFTGTYSTTSQPAFAAKNITIQNGGVLEITSGNTISAVNVTVEDGGNLIQKDGSSLSYSGAFKALKNGTSEINKYAFWTSPVAGQNLANIYTGATPTSITEYDTATDYYVNATSTTSVFAKAYSIKTPVANAALVFEGAPNSGTQTFALATSGNGFNLIGNPYPSSLSLGAFYTVNSARISSTFYFWDNKSTNVTLQNGATTTNYGYATFNAANGANPTWVPAPNGLGGTAVVPTGSVANIGQGFIVKTLNTSVDTSLTFNNEMRGTTNGTFFNKNNSSTEGKFWLRLNSEYNTNNTFAVDYTNGASDSFDNYDSKALGMGSDAFYTLADTQKLIIQGKESFDINDVVPVGAKHFQNGNFTIALVQKEGLFNNGQAIYLHDKITGIYTDLQNGAYTFTANSGESTDRFEIVYKLNVLATAEVQKDTFEVYRDGQDFVVRNNKNIEKVEIFDVAGRKIQTINESSKVIRVQLASKGVYILKASSEGKEYTKKIIK